MYDNKTHQVSDRIINLSQPYIRPIVRGKAKSPVEFGAKYDVSVDEKGHARLEKILILSIMVDRFSSRIYNPKLLPVKMNSIVVS